MMINVGATLPEDRFDIVTQYLATHFPGKPKPAAVVMPSPATICSGTPTMLAVTWGGSILLLARPVSGPLPGGPQSQPYGIIAVKDVLWYSEAGVKPNIVVHFDPKTETFQSWVIPSGGGVVRNMDVIRDGDPVLACSGVNGLAVVHVQ
jgi:hypothetical protein